MSLAAFLCLSCSIGFREMAYVKSRSLRFEIVKRYSQQNILLGLIGAHSPTRTSVCLRSRRYVGGIGGPTPGQIEPQGEDAEERTQPDPKKTRSSWSPTLFKMFESAATTFASILVLGLAGYGYHRVGWLSMQVVPISDYIIRPASYCLGVTCC